MLLLVPERPASAHDVLALLQVQRRDGARRVVRRSRTATGADGVQVNLLGPAARRAASARCRPVQLEQRTAYPFDGEVAIRVAPERSRDVQGSRENSAVGRPAPRFT